MTKSILVLGLLLASSAFASEVRSIQDFSIVRTGGGSSIIAVERDAKTGDVTATTIACDFKTLAPAEQAKSAQILGGWLAADATRILTDQAVLAETVMLKPIPPTGTFVSLTVDYIDSMTKTLNAQTIQNPIVLLDGAVSPVLSYIESSERTFAVKAGVCK